MFNVHSTILPSTITPGQVTGCLLLALDQPWGSQVFSCTVHCTRNNTEHCTLYTKHFILYSIQFTLFTVHCRMHTSQFTLHTPHCTLNTALCTLHTANCTVQTRLSESAGTREQFSEAKRILWGQQGILSRYFVANSQMSRPTHNYNFNLE